MDNELSEANAILARIVAAANMGALEGEDGFVWGYQMSVGPIHAAIPFLQKQGIVVTLKGEIRRFPDILDRMVAQAKADAGLDPSEKHPPRLWIDNLPAEWRRPFWARQLEMSEAASTVQSHG